MKPCEIPQDLKALNLAEIFTYMWENNFSYDAHNGRKAHGNPAQSCWPTTIDGRAKILGMSSATIKKIHDGDSTVSEKSVRRVARHLLSELEEGSPLWQEWLKLISSKYDELKGYEQDSTSAIEDEADAALLTHRLQPMHSSRTKRGPVLWAGALLAAVVLIGAWNQLSSISYFFQPDGDDGPRNPTGFFGGDGGGGGGEEEGGCCTEEPLIKNDGADFSDVDVTEPLRQVSLKLLAPGTFLAENRAQKRVQIIDIAIVWCHKAGEEGYEYQWTDGMTCHDLGESGVYRERKFHPSQPELLLLEAGDSKQFEYQRMFWERFFREHWPKDEDYEAPDPKEIRELWEADHSWIGEQHLEVKGHPSSHVADDMIENPDDYFCQISYKVNDFSEELETYLDGVSCEISSSFFLHNPAE